MDKAHILIVEDEEKIAALQRDYLVQAGFDVSELHDGTQAATHIVELAPDLVILDLMLPGEDGLTICRRVRESSDVPIIMVTARVDEIDRLLGLEFGADDYLCKPFSPRELVLRVKAILRRGSSEAQSAAGQIRYGALVLDPERHCCDCHGHRLDLTPVEFRLLQALLERPGRVLSRQQLMDVAYQDHRVVSDRTIDSHMRNLRQKLGDASGDEERDLIRSVYGVGYAMA